MQEIETLSDVAQLFKETEGLDANDLALESADLDRLLVKVLDEDAVGQFFKICREHDLKRESCTRGDLGYTVLDAYVSFD